MIRQAKVAKNRDADDISASGSWRIKKPKQQSEIRWGRVHFADGDGVAYISRNDIPTKLATYINDDTPYNLLVNWKNVFVLISKVYKSAQCHK